MSWVYELKPNCVPCPRTPCGAGQTFELLVAYQQATEAPEGSHHNSGIVSNKPASLHADLVVEQI